MSVYGGFSFEFYQGSDPDSNIIIIDSVDESNSIDSLIDGLDVEKPGVESFVVYTEMDKVDYSTINSVISTSNTDFYVLLDCNRSGFVVHSLGRAI